MTTTHRQKSRVADLEARNERGYVVPTIIRMIVNPDRSCDRAIVQSGPFNGFEMARRTGETTAEFEGRVSHELSLMQAETEASR